MKVFHLGVDESYPMYLQRKIILSNKIGILIGLTVPLPFIFISLIFFKAITIIPIIGVIVCFSTLFFNYLGLHSLARTIIAGLPTSLASVYGAYLNHAGEPALPGIALLQLSFTFIIFLVFDIREKGYIVSLCIYAWCLLISMDWLNNVLEINMDNQVISVGFLGKVSVALSMVVGWGSLLFLVLQNQDSEGELAKLLEVAEFNHKAMVEKEKDLEENVRKLEEARAEEKKRQWINEGLTTVSKIIRDQSSFSRLCDELISFTVTYLKANQGGLFIVNEKEENSAFIELQAAYAYERKKYLTKRVEIGEGLLGQAYLEKESIYLKEVPKNYVSITSGLGSGSPRSLIIIPMKFNENVLGIIELASFREFGAFEIHFLELLGENIAAAIQNRRISEKTNSILEKLQIQTEQMHAQEEEMRQNMEELAATQEELVRKEKQYLSRIKNLELELEKTSVYQSKVTLY